MKKVAICGTSRTLKEAPWNDDTFEFWIVNDMYQIVKGFHRLFEMHNKEYLDNYCTRYNGSSHIENMSTMPVPIYMQGHFIDIPSSVKYPIEEILKTFGRRYFQSTVDYMIALAIYEGYEEIHVYGVDMAVNEEYTYQKPSINYWLGVAEGKGIKIILPQNCDLLKAYFLYGYEQKQHTDFEIKATAKIKELETQEKEFLKNYYIAHGAKDTWEFVLQTLQKG